MKQNRNEGGLKDVGFTGHSDMPSPLSRAGLAEFAMCLFFSGVDGVHGEWPELLSRPPRL